MMCRSPRYSFTQHATIANVPSDEKRSRCTGAYRAGFSVYGGGFRQTSSSDIQNLPAKASAHGPFEFEAAVQQLAISADRSKALAIFKVPAPARRPRHERRSYDRRCIE